MRDASMARMNQQAIKTIETLRDVIGNSNFDGGDLARIILLDAAEFEGAGLEGLALTMGTVANVLIDVLLSMAAEVKKVLPDSTTAETPAQVYQLLRDTIGRPED